MPKCYDCGKEQPVLRSYAKMIDRVKDKFGKALCDECLEKAKAEDTKEGGKQFGCCFSFNKNDVKG